MDKQPQNRARLMSFLRNEGGIMAILFAILLPLFVIMAALALDMGYAYWKRNILQVDASASALAGAGVAMDDATVELDGTITYTLIDRDGDGVPDNNDFNSDGVKDGAVILIEALAYAEKNIRNEGVLHTFDVLPGNWDQDTRVFTSAGTWDPSTVIFDPGTGTIDASQAVFTPVTDPIVPLNAVMTTTRRANDGPNTNPLGLFFAKIVGMTTININTTAVATFEADAPPPLEACITALNTSDPRTFYVNGNASVEAPACNIDIYSDDPCALTAVGNPSVTVVSTTAGVEDGSINVSGGTCVTANVFLNPGPIEEYDDFAGDPFGYIEPTGDVCLDGNYCNLAINNIGETCTAGTADEQRFNIAENETLNLSGQVFCGGVRISGASGSKVVFDGDFVIRYGEFNVASSVRVESTVALVSSGGVGFYLMDGARVNMNGSPGGSAAVGLEAQNFGPLKDFLFFEGPNNNIEPRAMSLRGTPLGAFDGLIYFQNSDVEFKGTADGLLGVTDCTVLLADEIYFDGTTELFTDIACGGRTIPPVGLAKFALRLRN